MAQGLYFAGTGVWSLVDRRSFEAVSGRKVDYWLVRGVGSLLSAVGAALVVAARRRALTPELRAIALTTAVGLAAVDVAYASVGRISRVYLADAAAELALAGGWLLAARHGGAATADSAARSRREGPKTA